MLKEGIDHYCSRSASAGSALVADDSFGIRCIRQFCVLVAGFERDLDDAGRRCLSPVISGRKSSRYRYLGSSFNTRIFVLRYRDNMVANHQWPRSNTFKMPGAALAVDSRERFPGRRPQQSSSLLRVRWAIFEGSGAGGNLDKIDSSATFSFNSYSGLAIDQRQLIYKIRRRNS